MVTGLLAENSLHLLHCAVRWWQEEGGFAFVELPWVVPRCYCDGTRPPGTVDVTTPHGSFVASGEQSFLQLMDESRLPAGAPGYIGWTPCLRDEPVLDDLHQHAFMKAEWFVPLDTDAPGLAHLDKLVSMQMAMFAEVAFQDAGYTSLALTREDTGPSQVDLLLGGIEIGSYGVRNFQDRPYIYGTALALPRFSLALERADTSWQRRLLHARIPA